MSEPTVLISKDARGVATVTINRPKVRNAIDDTVIRSLTDAFKALHADAEARVVVLTGSGSAFCAGADLGWMRRMAAAGDAENFASAKTISAPYFSRLTLAPCALMASVARRTKSGVSTRMYLARTSHSGARDSASASSSTSCSSRERFSCGMKWNGTLKRSQKGWSRS